MVCVTGVLLGIFSTIVTLGIVAPLLVKWMMKRKANVVMQDVSSKMAAFIGTETETEINDKKEVEDGIKQDNESEESSRSKA